MNAEEPDTLLSSAVLRGACLVEVGTCHPHPRGQVPLTPEQLVVTHIVMGSEASGSRNHAMSSFQPIFLPVFILSYELFILEQLRIHRKIKQQTAFSHTRFPHDGRLPRGWRV